MAHFFVATYDPCHFVKTLEMASAFLNNFSSCPSPIFSTIPQPDQAPVVLWLYHDIPCVLHIFQWINSLIFPKNSPRIISFWNSTNSLI